MRVTEHADPGSFLDAAGPFLERKEALSGSLLGLALRYRRGEPPAEFPGAPYLATVSSAGQPVLAAARVGPRKLVLYGDGAGITDAVELLAARLDESGQEPPSVIGPRAVARAFAEAWSARRRRSPPDHAAMRLGVYELRRVRHHGHAGGRLRVAGDRDTDLLARWMFRFTRDAGVDLETDEEIIRRAVVARIDRGDFYLWEDDDPVCAAGRARPTAHGITVNSVYTPRDRRGRGYATTCVAALSQRMLDDGWSFCTLFTDMGNPAANAIYRRIGYEWVGEFGEYELATA